MERRRLRSRPVGGRPGGGGPAAGRIHVAQVGPEPGTPGGMPAVIAALMGSSLADRYRFEAISTYRDSRPLRRLLVFARGLLRLARWCARPGPRVAHVHMATRGSTYRKAVVVALVKTLRRPVVLQVHAGPGDMEDFFARLGPLRRLTLGWMLGRSDVVLCVSAAGAATLAALTDARAEVVPNAPPPLVDRGAAPAADGKLTALYLGGFADPAKGGAVLLEALPELLAERDDVEVVLAGPGEPHGALPERVEWRGWLTPAERDEALGRARLFLLPSLSEGMPIALLEAMSNRLPVIATRVGAVPELLTDGVDATLVEPGDAAALARAVAALAADRERLRELGEAVAERVRRLAEEDVYGRLDRIYLDAVR